MRDNVRDVMSPQPKTLEDNQAVAVVSSPRPRDTSAACAMKAVASISKGLVCFAAPKCLLEGRHDD